MPTRRAPADTKSVMWGEWSTDSCLVGDMWVVAAVGCCRGSGSGWCSPSSCCASGAWASWPWRGSGGPSSCSSVVPSSSTSVVTTARSERGRERFFRSSRKSRQKQSCRDVRIGLGGRNPAASSRQVQARGGGSSLSGVGSFLFRGEVRELGGLARRGPEAVSCAREPIDDDGMGSTHRERVRMPLGESSQDCGPFDASPAFPCHDRCVGCMGGGNETVYNREASSWTRVSRTFF